MDRKLLDYLPPVLRDVMEMRAINEANEPEICAAWNALTRVLDNQFIETADAQGVAVWENELRLYPKDTDTLDSRKARIKAIWNARLPYSLRWLEGWLDGICGAGGHVESVKDYTLTVRLNHGAMLKAGVSAAEILAMLPPYIPANLLIEIFADIRPEPFVNKPDVFCLHRLTQRMAFTNIRRPWVRFDGARTFDGGISFDQQPAGINFPRFVLSARFSNLRRGRAVRFDGEVSFGGEISFEQTISGVGAPAFGVRLHFGNSVKAGASTFSVRQRLVHGTGAVKTVSVVFLAAFSHAHNLGAALTTDSRWSFDGSVKLDGSRKFNAGIIKEEL